MTKIQWAEKTWNPLVGCKAVSDGCANCYAASMAWRHAHNPITKHVYENTVRISGERPVWTGAVNVNRAAIIAPIKWRKPHKIFVCSMSDLFYDGHDPEDVRLIFEVMAEAANHHTYLLLTKRPMRMKEMIDEWWGGVPDNVWIGVSVENQKAAEERIPTLLSIDAKVRFVSCEPLLGPVDLFQSGAGPLADREPSLEQMQMGGWRTVRYGASRIDWVIIGGESGPKARECHIEWIHDLLMQCRDAHIPAFVKQLGYRPIYKGQPMKLRDKKGGDMSEWPEHLRMREWPAMNGNAANQ